MNDYLKVAALVALFTLGSAIESAEANPNQWVQQQHRQNTQRQQQFTRQHQDSYYSNHGSQRQQQIYRQQRLARDQARAARGAR